MTFEELKQKCLQDGVLYEDPDFPANNNSLYFSKLEWGIKWKRPKEISKPNEPKFVSQGISRFDLIQSESLGNCWLIAGAAIALSGKDFLSNKVIPLDQDFGRDYAGIFRFRFWQFGQWEEVIIDDRLPVKYDGRLAFCHNNNDPHEYWGALMEKAYAKLNGSYEALEGGWIQDSMVDFTGGVGDTIDLADRDNIPPDLFNTIHTNIHMDTIMGSANIVIDPRLIETATSNGILNGHAYSITRTAKVRSGGKDQNLIQLRNPWGQLEYHGAWSDGSPEWNSLSDSQRRDLGIVNQEDGEFWMPYEEWLTSFNSLDMCYLPPENNTPAKQQWQNHVFHSEWVANVSAGGAGFLSHQKFEYWKNPQFTVTLKQEENVVISLMQKGNLLRRTQLKRANADYAIAFDVYLIRGEVKSDSSSNYAEKELNLVARTGKTYPGHIYRRQLTAHMKLQAGSYVIIPSTFEVNQVGEFLLRVYTDAAADAMAIAPADADPSESQSQEVPDPPPEVFPQSPPDLTLDEIYRTYSDNKGLIGAAELQKILHQAIMTEFHENGLLDIEVCREFIAMKDAEKDDRINRGQFQLLWKELEMWHRSFKQHDYNRSSSLDAGELAGLLSAIGLRVPRDVVTVLMKKYGDHDSRVRFPEFMSVVIKLISVMRLNENGTLTPEKITAKVLES